MYFMKQVIVSALALATLVIASCSKTISVDTPLPSVRKQSVLITTDDGKMYCIDAATGVKRWEYKFVNASQNPGVETIPVVYKDVAFTSYFGGLVAIDMFTGKEKWTKTTPLNIRKSVTIDNELLYFGTANGSKDSLYCFDLNGNRVWAFGDAAINQVSSSPTIAKGCVYFTTSNGRVFCVDKQTGKLATHGVPNYFSNPYVAGTDIRNSPQYFNGKLYVSVDSKVICLNDSLKRTNPIAAGTPLIWSYTASALPVPSSPLVYGDMCLVGTQEGVAHCIDATAGVASFRWRYNADLKMNGSVGLDKANETILVGSNDFNLHAIDFVTGKMKWKFPTGSVVNTSPISTDGKIYFTSFDKNLYCINANDAKLIWKYNLNNETKASPMIYNVDNSCIYPAESGNSAN